MATIGCNRNVSPGADVEHATQVTFEQLKEATQEEVSFKWVGSDKDFHYFETQKGFYRLPTESKMPRFQNQADMMIANGVKPGSYKVRVFINGETITYRPSHMDK